MNDTLLIVLVDVVGVPVAPPAPVTAFVPLGVFDPKLIVEPESVYAFPEPL